MILKKKPLLVFGFALIIHTIDSEEFRQVFGDDFDTELLIIEMKSVALFIDTWDKPKYMKTSLMVSIM